MADENKPSKRSLLKRLAGYSLVFLVAFGATLYWSLPYDLVGKRILRTVSRQSGVKIETASISPYWFVGVEARGVKIDVPAKRPGDTPLSVSLDKVTARLKPLDSLLGGPAVAFTAAAPEGEVDGTVQQQKGQKVHLAATVHGLALGKIPGLWDNLGVGFQGRVQGRVSGTMKQGDAQTLNGLVDLTVKGARFGGGMIHGFTVPGVDLGDVHLQAIAEKGVLKVDPPLKIHSKDLDADLSGTVHLRRIALTSAADLTLRFKPTDAFWRANGKLAGLAQAVLQNARGRDGFYAYRVTGVLGRPMVLPKR